MKELARELERVEKQARVHEIKVSDLRADLIGCPVIMHVQVVGEISQKALPSLIEFVCGECGLKRTISLDDLTDFERYFFLETIVFSSSVKRLARLIAEPCKGRASHVFSARVVDYMDFTVLFVRDMLDPLQKFDQRVYKTRKMYLVNQRLPYAKKVTVRGKVFLEPKTSNITVIADFVQPYEDEVTGFQASEEDKEAWAKYFMGSHEGELLSQIAPGMIERPLAQKALHLILHSVAVIPDIYGQPIRGSLRGVFYGDTKTYKSLSAKDLTVEHYGFGDYVVGESSSRTGITYTIDSDNNALIWGALPLNDLGFVVVDGMQSLRKDEWRETREALESQRVVVRRSLSGEALARTRILGIINPGTKNQRPINSYIFKCQALTDTLVFSDPPDITRWDFFIPFAGADVAADKIAEAKPAERPIPDQVFVRHVFWAWSRRPEDVKYCEEAKNRIIEETKRFTTSYAVDSTPIVHLGFREVLTRVAVAYACWLHSTDPTHTKVIVKEHHVEKAAEFLDKVAESLDLQAFKLEEEGKQGILPGEVEEIIADLDDVTLKILDQIKVKPKNSGELAELLDTTPITIKRRYAVLRKHELIKTTPGQGVSLSARGVNFLKQYLGIKVSKTDTSEGEQVSKNDTVIPAPTITEKNVAMVVLLSQPYQGKCAICGKTAVLYHQIETFQGEWGHVCQDCGESIKQRL